MIKTGLQNEQLVSNLLISGSLGIKSKNTNGINLFEELDVNDGVISAKLTKPNYDNTELKKSIDTVIVELIPIQAPDLPDTVLRSVYNPVTQSVIDLTAEVVILNNNIVDLRAKVSSLEIVTQSLRVEIDNQKIITATFQNQTQLANSTIETSIVDLQNSIQKATSEAIQRVSLNARNQSLEQEISALRIDISAKEQSLKAGAVSTGQIASILFDKGDPTKETTKQMIGMDYGGGSAPSGQFAAAGNEYQKTFRSYFEVIASSALTGTKEISLDLKFTGRATQSPWDFGVTFPLKLKNGETKRFEFKKASDYWKKQQGQYDVGWGPWLSWHPSEWDFTMSIIVTDSEGKTENKDFTFHIYKYQ
jgi:hypothetical protein